MHPRRCAGRQFDRQGMDLVYAVLADETARVAVG